MKAGGTRRSDKYISERRELPRHPASSGDTPFIRERRSSESHPDIETDSQNPMVRERRTGLEKFVKTVTSFASSVANTSKSFHADPIGTLFNDDVRSSQQSFSDPDSNSDIASIQNRYRQLSQSSQESTTSSEEPVIGADVSEMPLAKQNQQLMKLLETSLDYKSGNQMAAALNDVERRLEQMVPEDISPEVKQTIRKRYEQYDRLNSLI